MRDQRTKDSYEKFFKFMLFIADLFFTIFDSIIDATYESIFVLSKILLARLKRSSIFSRRKHVLISNRNKGPLWKDLRPATLLKKALVQVFSCEFCKIFTNTFFIQHIRATASVSRIAVRADTTVFITSV